MKFGHLEPINYTILSVSLPVPHQIFTYVGLNVGPGITFITNKKGGAHWSYGWIPVVAPILGAIIGIFLYKIPFGL